MIPGKLLREIRNGHKAKYIRSKVKQTMKANNTFYITAPMTWTFYLRYVDALGFPPLGATLLERKNLLCWQARHIDVWNKRQEEVAKYKALGSKHYSVTNI